VVENAKNITPHNPYYVTMNLPACAASVKLTVNNRKAMTVWALAGAEPISALAARHGVSRSLVYRQMRKANVALHCMLSPSTIMDLSVILAGLHDELFQGSQPLLSSIDTASS
jgi:hypothetical protein